MVPVVMATCGLLLGACSDGDQAESPTTTTSAASTSAAATSTTAPATSTSTTTTQAPDDTPVTTTTVASGEGEFVITQVIFGTVRYVALTNVGQGPGSLRDLWLCQRPNYFELPDVEIAPGDAAAIVIGGGELPDLIGISHVADAGISLGVLSASGGEIGLFRGASFSDPDAIIDYVRWGSPGSAGRSDTAVAAGIWPEDAAVEVPEELLALTIANLPTAGPGDWIAEIGG